LNRSAVDMAYMPMSNFGDSLSFSVRMAFGSNGEDEEQFGIPLKIQALAKTGDSVKFFTRTACQLRVRYPNRCGVIKDLA